ncbi:alanine racemase [uncultured Tateyamaria sp.]|uniref:alanine racemase n=1 Tax=uncultured Tateyamaria sp. TaxID=455651 RepID=UPI002629EB20|nr:alanine racemase [uncultured Tateyamaria sp.]
MTVKSHSELADEVSRLMLPTETVATPAFVIDEAAMAHNLDATATAAGGIDRLMPHVKTHRAPWICIWMLGRGVTAFKAATPLEVRMCLDAKAPRVLWAYPTANGANIAKVLAAAESHPDSEVQVLFDCVEGLDAWDSALQEATVDNLSLVLDLDPGMGRTGADIEGNAFDLASDAARRTRFSGFHIYDGHIQDIERSVRIQKNDAIVTRVKDLFERAKDAGLPTQLTASGSWSFDIWPKDVADYVSPGSFIYSSAQHTKELPHLDWKMAAYVLSSVVSARPGSATLDAGSKAISPDMRLSERFFGPGAITAMKEEHAVIETDALNVGQFVPLIPRHTCTTAYLFPEALVRRLDGTWETMPQLGNQR